jgi:hypothetical protein
MSDTPDRTFVDRAAAALDRDRPREVVPPGRFAPAPAPGFKFAIGDRVLDLVDAVPALIRAAYHGAASGLRVYELSTDAGAVIVRDETQLEPWKG